jgi:hypothetical protein
MHRTSCETVGDNFNKLQSYRNRFAAIGPVLKPPDQLQNHPARFKTIQQL